MEKIQRLLVWGKRNKIKKTILLYLIGRRRRLSTKKNNITRKFYVHPLNTPTKRKEQGDFDNLLLEMRTKDPQKFFNHLRMSPELFDLLLEKVSGMIEKQPFRETVSPGIRLAMTLRYVASGDLMVSIARQFRVSQSFTSETIRQTATAIWVALKEEYLPKISSEDQWKLIAKEFENRWNFPNCLSALDGKHIVIESPVHSGSAYFNYKQCHSVVLMAGCDANYQFTFVDIGAEGRNSDGGIFRQSKIGKKFFNNEFSVPCPTKISEERPPVPYMMVADAAFPMTNFLVKPYSSRNLISQEEKVFNYRLSRARRCIENAFGILASRFRIFRRPIKCSLETLDAIIKACVCLHNFLIKNKREFYCPPNFNDTELPNGEIIPGQWRNDSIPLENLKSISLGTNNYSNNAAEVRNILRDFFVNEGAVPFQWTRLNNW